MQLMPETADRFGVSNVCDPAQNIDAGVRYLRELGDEFLNPLLVAAAYNAGEGRVRQYGGIPPFKETVRYVAEVVNIQLGLSGLSPGAREKPVTTRKVCSARQRCHQGTSSVDSGSAESCISSRESRHAQRQQPYPQPSQLAENCCRCDGWIGAFVMADPSFAQSSGPFAPLETAVQMIVDFITGPFRSAARDHRRHRSRLPRLRRAPFLVHRRRGRARHRSGLRRTGDRRRDDRRRRELSDGRSLPTTSPNSRRW